LTVTTTAPTATICDGIETSLGSDSEFRLAVAWAQIPPQSKCQQKEGMPTTRREEKTEAGRSWELSPAVSDDSSMLNRMASVRHRKSGPHKSLPRINRQGGWSGCEEASFQPNQETWRWRQSVSSGRIASGPQYGAMCEAELHQFRSSSLVSFDGIATFFILSHTMFMSLLIVSITGSSRVVSSSVPPTPTPCGAWADGAIESGVMFSITLRCAGVTKQPYRSYPPWIPVMSDDPHKPPHENEGMAPASLDGRVAVPGVWKSQCGSALREEA